jgi:hypothetical protein
MGERGALLNAGCTEGTQAATEDSLNTHKNSSAEKIELQLPDNPKGAPIK